MKTEYDYVLTLTEDEAKFLAALIGYHCLGHKRELSHPIYSALVEITGPIQEIKCRHEFTAYTKRPALYIEE